MHSDIRSFFILFTINWFHIDNVGKTSLIERTNLIKHTSSKTNQEELRRQQNAERTNTNTDNQAFLTDVNI